jgi:hypothetical protein
MPLLNCIVVLPSHRVGMEAPGAAGNPWNPRKPWPGFPLCARCSLTEQMQMHTNMQKLVAAMARRSFYALMDATLKRDTTESHDYLT